jgi:hypothetical protein
MRWVASGALLGAAFLVFGHEPALLRWLISTAFALVVHGVALFVSPLDVLVHLLGGRSHGNSGEGR